MKNVDGRIKTGSFRTYSILGIFRKIFKIFDDIVESGSHLEWIIQMGQRYDDLTPVVQVGGI